MTTDNGLKFLQSVNQSFDEAGRYVDISEDQLDSIKSCNTVLQVNFRVKINGEMKVISGYRAQVCIVNLY